jgi:YgiT-type zinc finger domain-containing protein
MVLEPTEAAPIYCEQCRIGHYRSTKAAFIYWVDAQVLVMPNAPAYTCDICGQIQYEAAFLSKIDILLQEMEKGLPTEEKTRQRLAPETAVTWPSTRSMK